MISCLSLACRGAVIGASFWLLHFLLFRLQLFLALFLLHEPPEFAVSVHDICEHQVYQIVIGNLLAESLLVQLFVLLKSTER